MKWIKWKMSVRLWKNTVHYFKAKPLALWNHLKMR